MSLPAIREIQTAAGATFGTDGRPTVFANVADEVRSARQAVALFDLTNTAVLEVFGPDATDYLHRMLTCSVKDLKPGATRQGTALKGDGRMIADVLVRRAEPQRFHLFAPPVCRPHLVAHLEKFLIMEDAAVRDLTDECAVFSIWGPRAASEDLQPLIQQSQAESASADPSSLGTLFIPVAGSRIPSQLAVTPTGNAAQLYTRLSEWVTQAGGRLAGEEARRILRIEEGIPEFGVDMDETTIPLEAGLKDAIDFRKGCFPGQEIVARIENLGHPAKVLRPLTFRSSTPPKAGDELFYEGKNVGRLTGVAESPTAGKTIAIAYVKWDQREPGTALSLGSPDSTDRAIVAEAPVIGS